MLELIETPGVRLGAAKEGIADFSAVGRTGDFLFFAQRRSGNHRGRIFFGLREDLWNSAKGKNKQRAKEKMFHRRLDAKSLARVVRERI